jgi:hypothetical protein
MILNDLNFLAKQIEEKNKTYDFRESQLSEEFKIEFESYLNSNSKDKIEFEKYTSIVTTSKGLKIIFPNQWFYIASFFYDFLNSLWIYKDLVIDFKISDEVIKNARGNTIDDSLKNNIKKVLTKEEDYAFFEKFLTDYDWWYGSKTLDRGDFYVSSVLNLAKVVNVSHSYLADIAYYISKEKKLSDLLNKDYEVFLNKTEKQNDKILIEDKKLRVILFKTFKYVLNKYSEDIVLEGYELKEAKIEDRIYNGLTLPKYFGFETLVGLFDKTQNIDELKSSGTPRFIEEKIDVLGNQNTYFTSQWNGVDNGRGLSLENFNRLLFDISNGTIEIVKKDNIYRLIEKSLSNHKSSLTKPENIIYYGSPGTGKSYKVNEKLISLDKKFYERITFHPEFDNASFVGGYRPISELNSEGVNEIKYKFVPQAFANIYKKAWEDLDNQYYLAIEEINRGNCAEIFGDIFQLLDRNSNYSVSPSNELREHIVSLLGEEHEGIKYGLKLPPNLSLLATMNTSDQSLFPMDSAFKRRWDWEYIPISYDKDASNKSSNYFVKIDETNSFNWIDFIKAVNYKIKHNRNLGPDKCIGNYFIKPEGYQISLNEFINKAVFYLWNDVFKDEDETDSIFKEGVHYEDFFPIETEGKKLILEILKTDDFKLILESIDNNVSEIKE